MTRNQQVVVAFDFSALGPAILARAVALATRAPAHILHFVTVIDPHAGVPGLPHQGPIDYHYADRIRELLADEVRKAFGALPIFSEEVHFFIHARIGKPAQEIVGLAEEIGADLILIGTHGFTGVKRVMMGSTAEHVVREAKCPVLVVREKTYADVELATVTRLENHVLHRFRPHRLSYQKSQLVMHPPDWTIVP